MARYIAAAIVGCLYAAGSVWVVRNEGAAYRQTLVQARRETNPTESPAPGPPGKKGSEGVSVAPETTIPGPTPPRARPATTPTPPPPPPRPKAAAEDSATGPVETTQPSRPVGGESLPVPEVNRVAMAKPAPAPTGDRAPVPVRSEGTTSGQGPASRPPNLGPFWDQPVLKTSWDLAKLTIEGEKRLGSELHELILHFHRTVEAGPWLARVEDAAEPFLNARARKDISYTFTILDSDAVNAFSHPGGFVYVSRGLFDLVGEEEDYALEFVVGHEIAHVDLQHALKCLRDPGVLRLTEGTLQKLYMMIIPFGFTDAQEYEADAWVFRRMKELGHTERESLAFLRKLEGYAQNNGFINGRGKPPVSPDSSPLENHIRAHTAVRKRLKSLKEIMGRASSSTR